LEERFGIRINDDGPLENSSLEEIERQFDITRERIRQIEKKALTKLKNKSTKPKADKTPNEPSCSFCGKNKSEVKHLVASEKNIAMICDQCVALCLNVLKDLDE